MFRIRIQRIRIWIKAFSWIRIRIQTVAESGFWSSIPRWYCFCLLMEGSGSVLVTSGSGCGSGRPQNKRIRIHNNGMYGVPDILYPLHGRRIASRFHCQAPDCTLQINDLNLNFIDSSYFKYGLDQGSWYTDVIAQKISNILTTGSMRSHVHSV